MTGAFVAWSVALCGVQAVRLRVSLPRASAVAILLRALSAHFEVILDLSLSRLISLRADVEDVEHKRVVHGFDANVDFLAVLWSRSSEIRRPR